ncbi:MFS transporter [Peribacillus simplex]|uniref:MFS transporter n=1 Tax=Peribacillus simplex TaxID=1478 RepID=UPI00298E3E0C|nr:MFS transporter [Peribacillus simplex]MDW7617331.1 MFS transporter [Peribacillus simplex]
MLQTFKTVLSNKNYILLFCANLTSQMGSTIGLTAFMYFVLDKYSTQPSYATITELIYTLPILFVFFIVGVLADSMNRKKIAVNSELICALLSILLLVCVIQDWMFFVFAILFIRSAVSKFFQPAQQAIIQGILSKDEYTVSASMNQLVSSLFLLFGSGIGLLAYWKIGLQGAIVIDAVSFIISGLLIHYCSIKQEICLPNGLSKWKDLNLNSIMTSYKEGLNYIFQKKLLLSLTFGFCIFGIISGGLSIMPVFIMKYKIAPENYEFAMVRVSIVFGCGMLLGSIFASILANKFKLYQLIVTGLTVTGFFIGISGLTNNMYYFLTLNFIAALFLPLINIGISGWLPSIIDSKMMGRVQGCITPLIMLFQSLTLGIIAVLFPKHLTIEWLFILVGGLLVLVSLIYYVLLPRYIYEEENKIKLAV